MIDLNRIKANYLMDDLTMANLIDIFMDNSKNDLFLLESAIKNKNAADIHKLSHKLKSGYGYLYLTKISSQFEEIQNLSKVDVDFNKIDQLFAICKTDCAVVSNYIDKSKKS